MIEVALVAQSLGSGAGGGSVRCVEVATIFRSWCIRPGGPRVHLPNQKLIGLKPLFLGTGQLQGHFFKLCFGGPTGVRGEQM